MFDHARSCASLPQDGRVPVGRDSRRGVPTRAALAALSVLLLSGCTTSVVPFEYRGKLIEKRLVKTEHQPSFTVKLLKSSGSVPQLAFAAYDVVTYHEIPRYEKLLEYRPQHALEEADHDSIRRELVPGETIDGRLETRTERRELGPLVNSRVSLDGVAIETDANGVYVDSAERLLRLFDKPYTPEARLRFAHAGSGETALTVTRSEFLASMDVSEETTTRTSRDGVRYSLALDPEKPRPGDTLRLTLSVGNQGERAIDSVQARSISTHEWISGKNFYIGTLRPGEAKSFSRSFTVPNVNAPTTVFAAVGVRDRLGPAEDHTLPVVLTLQPH